MAPIGDIGGTKSVGVARDTRKQERHGGSPLGRGRGGGEYDATAPARGRPRRWGACLTSPRRRGCRWVRGGRGWPWKPWNTICTQRRSGRGSGGCWGRRAVALCFERGWTMHLSRVLWGTEVATPPCREREEGSRATGNVQLGCGGPEAGAGTGALYSFLTTICHGNVGGCCGGSSSGGRGRFGGRRSWCCCCAAASLAAATSRGVVRTLVHAWYRAPSVRA